MTLSEDRRSDTGRNRETGMRLTKRHAQGVDSREKRNERKYNAGDRARETTDEEEYIFKATHQGAARNATVVHFRRVLRRQT